MRTGWTSHMVQYIAGDDTLGVIAWDVSDAIAKTAEETGFDLGMDVIQRHVGEFLANCLNDQARCDAREASKS